MFPQFDPSKLDPKILMELSQLIQTLPRENLMKMQALMPKMMSGADLSQEMLELEKSFPPGFREKLMSLMGGAPSFMPNLAPAPTQARSVVASTDPLTDARLTLLRGVADGQIAPEEALGLLFPESKD